MTKSNLSKGEILDVRSDRYFHDIFNRRNTKLLTFLLSQLLEKDTSEVKNKFTILNVRLPNTTKKEKQKYCDYYFKYGDTYIILEINNNFRGLHVRNDLYLFNNIINEYGLDDKSYYTKKIKFKLFNLNWHKYEMDKKRTKKEVHVLPRSYKEKDILLEIVNINIDYFVDKCYNEVEKFEKIFKLLTINNKKELIEATEGNEYLKEYRNEVLRLNEYLKEYRNEVLRLNERSEYVNMILNERIEKRLAEEEAYFDGERAGIELGIEQGIEQNQRIVILNMHKNKLPINIIAKYVNIAVDEVKRIIKEAQSDKSLKTVK